MQRRVLILVIFFLVFSLNSFCVYRYISGVFPVNNRELHISSDSLNTGDIILRRGKGMISRWFAGMSLHDARFSHAGIVLIQNGKVCVLSSTQDAKEPGIQVQSPEEFLQSAITEEFGVYRLPLSKVQLAEIARDLSGDLEFRRGFDNAYSLDSDSVFYCTEYIYKRVNRYAEGMITVSHYGDWDYIAPEDLYLHNAGRFIISAKSH